jgi:hypothetical protein
MPAMPGSVSVALKKDMIASRNTMFRITLMTAMTPAAR